MTMAMETNKIVTTTTSTTTTTTTLGNNFVNKFSLLWPELIQNSSSGFDSEYRIIDWRGASAKGSSIISSHLN